MGGWWRDVGAGHGGYWNIAFSVVVSTLIYRFIGVGCPPPPPRLPRPLWHLDPLCVGVGVGVCSVAPRKVGRTYRVRLAKE